MNKLLRSIGAIVVIIMLMGMTVRGEEVYEYTLLIYMNGSDLESEYYAATDDFLEMIAGDIPSNIAVIVQTGGTNDWHTDEYGLPTISTRQVQRWRVTDTELELLEDVGAYNMGDSGTLNDFIDYSVGNYSADQYGIIFWNHGAGAVYGFGADEVYDYDTLTLDEIQTAMEDSYEETGTLFDIVGFDACLMGSVEVAHVFEPYAKYLIASEELEPSHGWNYEAVMNHMSTNPDTSPTDFGEAIIKGFINQSEEAWTDDSITLSLIDLSKIPEVIVALDELIQQLDKGLEITEVKEKILKARLKAESYGDGSEESGVPDSDMVDIIDYATLLKEMYPIEASRVIQAVEEAVISSINSITKPKATGLSIYIPSKDKETMVIAKAALEKIDMSDMYSDYIDKLSDIITTGGASIDYDTSTTIIDESNIDEIDTMLEDYNIDGDDEYYYFKIDEADLSAVSEIYTIMGYVDTDEAITYLAKDIVDDEAILEDGTIIGETIDYWVQINGIDVAMYYESHDQSGVLKYYIPIVLNGEDADLIVLFSETYPKGKILGARKLDTDHENVYNRSLIKLKPEDMIEFVYEYDPYDILEDSYGESGWSISEAIVVGLGLEFLWQPMISGEYAYRFEVVDIYGDIYTSDWIIYDYYDSAPEGEIVDDIIWDNLEGNEGEMTTETYIWIGENVSLPSEWAIPYVDIAYENGLTTPSTMVDFNTNITREEFCELVVNMYETIIGKNIAISNPNIFSDTANIEIVKAYQLGIVTGYEDGTFRPTEEINREQLITMFYRAITELDGSIGRYYYPETDFDDKADISLWASEATRFMISLELINGVGDNKLAPKDKATIEQSLKLVYVVYDFYEAYSTYNNGK